MSVFDTKKHWFILGQLYLVLTKSNQSLCQISYTFYLEKSLIESAPNWNIRLIKSKEHVCASAAAADGIL